MLRIKIPLGILTARQCEVLADLSEEYADSISHITTRQDVQYHFVDILDTPNIMRRLASCGITTKEACGNTVRNVTCCPDAGVCTDEVFDVTPHARAMAYFLLRHPDAQNFGRKFKISFSGCAQHHCGLARIHDIGAIGATKEIDGETVEGFAVYVGGGLGAVPHQAQLYSDFVPAGEMLPLAQAIARVFARLGEKNKRARARMKFLVANLGIDEFRKNIEEELARLPEDALREQIMDEAHSQKEGPLKPPSELNLEAPGLEEGFRVWHRHNVRAQGQEGYSMVTVSLALGDLTADQLRGVGTISRKYIKDTIRATVPQNLLLRWVSNEDLPALYRDLTALRLASPLADSVADITACPGTDSCKLGIASSRGLAGVLHRQFTEDAVTGKGMGDGDGGLRDDITIKISGCFNSCAQHHIADIGFYGNSRGIDGRRVPHFQVVLGGRRSHNADTFGMAIGAVPSKVAPQVMDTITEEFLAGREEDEQFHDWTQRLGKRGLRAIIEPFMEIPRFEEQPDFFVDHADARPFTMGDLGVGECAGEVVSLFGIEVVRAEAEVFEAQVALDESDPEGAENHAYKAMLLGARALVRTEFIDVTDEPDDIVREWKQRFFDTELFHDRFAKGKFGRYLLERHEDPTPSGDPATAARRTEEAQLFVEACHACDAKITAQKTAIEEVPA
jgi:sulfite reductase (ferredoxin)